MKDSLRIYILTCKHDWVVDLEQLREGETRNSQAGNNIPWSKASKRLGPRKA